MPAIERQITINALPEQVFGYISDFTRHPEWAAHKLKLEQTSSGPAGVGTSFASVGHQMGRDFESEVKITEFAPGEKLTFESEGKDFHFRHSFLLQAENGRTRLTKGGEAQRVGFPFNVLLPLLRLAGVLSRGLDGDLKRIKANLEGGSQAARAPAPQAAPETPAEPSPEEGGPGEEPREGE